VVTSQSYLGGKVRQIGCIQTFAVMTDFLADLYCLITIITDFLTDLTDFFTVMTDFKTDFYRHGGLYTTKLINSKVKAHIIRSYRYMKLGFGKIWINSKVKLTYTYKKLQV
jgi:hypothetical protein